MRAKPPRVSPLQLAAFVLAKGLRSAALFIASEHLFHTSTPIALFVCCTLCSAVPFLLAASVPLRLLRWRSTARCSPALLAGVAAHGLTRACALALWALGLKHCGPTRTVLFDYSGLWFLSLVSAIRRRRCLSPRSAAAAAALLLGYALLLTTHGIHHRSSVTVRLDSTSSWAESMCGELALLAAASLAALAKALSPPLAAALGGPQRLFALATCAGAALATPLAAAALARASAEEWRAFFPPATFARYLAFALLAIVIDLHVDTAVHALLPAADAASLGVGVSFVGACALEWARGAPSASALSCLCAAIVILGLRLLLEQQTYAQQLVEASEALPLVSAREARRHGVYAPAAGSRAPLRQFAQQLLGTRESRRLLAFLGLNLGFAAIEARGAGLSNSLALLSDAAHMLFDSCALLLGLLGNLAARWPASALRAPFGYARVEPLCGFVHALLLVLTSLSIAKTACARLSRPQAVDDQLSLPVACAGLGVNVLGMLLFQEHYTGGAAGCGGCGCAAAGGADDDNMRGVALHMAADALGSVSAIGAALLTRHLGWRRADPLCSLATALLVLLSALPLLRRATAPLLLRTPAELEIERPRLLRALGELPRVAAVRELRLWTHTNSRTVGMLVVSVAPGACERRVLRDASGVLRGFGVTDVSVQVEVEACQHRDL